MHRYRRKTALLTLLILLAAVSALWYWSYLQEAKRAPVSNASFVLAGSILGGKKMKDDARSQLPLNDANGNAGTHPPQREVYYEACQATEQKNREWNAER